MIFTPPLVSAIPCCARPDSFCPPPWGAVTWTMSCYQPSCWTRTVVNHRGRQRTARKGGPHWPGLVGGGGGTHRHRLLRHAPHGVALRGVQQDRTPPLA